jgi:periplasmic protein TonB
MEQRLFEDLIDSDTATHRTRQGRILPVSVAIHAIVLAFILIVPILTGQDLPNPTSVVRAFFVEPPTAPPPPPPPPPPAPRATIVHKVQPVTPTDPGKFVAPIDVPDEIPMDQEFDDMGVEGGVAGGVEGGVAGGVVGGVVGGLANVQPQQEAVRVGGQIKEPKKLKNVNPEYPPIARKARVQGVVQLECTISPQGKVTNVTVVKGIPLLNKAAEEAVKQWVYTPTLLNGVPVPVIMTVTVNFRLN